MFESIIVSNGPTDPPSTQTQISRASLTGTSGYVFHTFSRILVPDATILGPEIPRPRNLCGL